MVKERLLKFIRDGIHERFNSIDDRRYKYATINESELKDLSKEIERFISLAESCGSPDNFRGECSFMERKFESLCAECAYNKHALNERYSLGFTNPFEKPESIEPSPDKYVSGSNDDGVSICNISIGSTAPNTGVYVNNGSVKANKYFSKGDVIEKCPVRIISAPEMRSDIMKEFSFPVDEYHRNYGIPFGYASYYLDSYSSKMEPNARYEYVPGKGDSEGFLDIIAIKPIKRGDFVVLVSDETDFENEVRHGQFDYEDDDLMEIADFKFA